VPVWVLDTGYAVHADLKFVVIPGYEAFQEPPFLTKNRHGLHVAGIIGARHGNDQGIDGGCRYCDLRVASIARKDPRTGGPREHFDTLLQLLAEAADEEVPPQVINVSLGVNWKTINIIEKVPRPADKQTLSQQALLLRPTLQKLADKQVIVVAAGGNDSDHLAAPPRVVECEWGNVINHTALSSNPVLKNVLVVEAIDRKGKRCSFSNVKGSSAAAGDQMHSLTHYDQNFEPKPGVILLSGTSQATPLVTALIAQLYAYNPEVDGRERPPRSSPSSHGAAGEPKGDRRLRGDASRPPPTRSPTSPIWTATAKSQTRTRRDWKKRARLAALPRPTTTGLGKT
jgi:subtilisin family serine protease